MTSRGPRSTRANITLTLFLQLLEALVHLALQAGPFGKLILRRRLLQFGFVEEDLLAKLPLLLRVRAEDELRVGVEGNVLEEGLADPSDHLGHQDLQKNDDRKIRLSHVVEEGEEECVDDVKRSGSPLTLWTSMECIVERHPRTWGARGGEKAEMRGRIIEHYRIATVSLVPLMIIRRRK